MPTCFRNLRPVMPRSFGCRRRTTIRWSRPSISAAALEHPASAPKLEPLDTVHIFGRYDFEPDPEVFITGEVRAPGSYRTSGQQHLRDAVYQAGGVTPDAWLDSAQLFRRQPDGTTRVLSINLSGALGGDPLNNVLLQPRDRILVHRQPEQVSPRSVYVKGDVARPGRYPLAVNMSVSDLVAFRRRIAAKREPRWRRPDALCVL